MFFFENCGKSKLLVILLFALFWSKQQKGMVPKDASAMSLYLPPGILRAVTARNAAIICIPVYNLRTHIVFKYFYMGDQTSDHELLEFCT